MAKFVLNIAVGCAALLSGFSSESCKDPASRGYFTTSDGVRLSYVEAGRGPGMVFVPGWMMPATIWQPQIRHFARRFHVVALDPRSQGESAKPAEGHFPERRARDIKELIDRLRLGPAVLVGWSLGVQELLTFADQFGTENVRAMVLVDGFLGKNPAQTPLEEVNKWTRELQTDRDKFTRAFVRGLFAKKQSEEFLKKLQIEANKTPTQAACVLITNVLAKDFRPMLGKVKCPLLYVITPRLVEDAKTLQTKVPAAKVELFKDCGHAVFLDDPDRFNAVVDEFLRALSKTQSGKSTRG